MSFSPLIDELVNSLRCLPGVGAKTAQRMAFHLLERDRQGANRLAESMTAAMASVGHCRRCRTLTEETECKICASSRRDQTQLCVVESPADVVAIEQTSSYSGLYFVLHGHLSPIDGLGPEDIGIPQLLELLNSQDVQELVIATNPTVEGEATAHFISSHAKALSIPVSRIAHGVPLGGELEYVDGGTLAHAFAGRRQL